MRILVLNGILAACILLAATGRAATPDIPDGTEFKVRTTLADENIVAVSNNGKFFAIVCSRPTLGFVGSSSADFLFQNVDGNLIMKDYNVNRIQFNAASPAKSPYLPMDSASVDQICNYPNGLYSLEVKGGVVTYKGGTAYEAAGRPQRSRGF